MNNKNRKGFTLVELIVVISILAVLALILVPSVIGYTARAKEEVCKLNRQELKQELVIEANNETTAFQKIGDWNEIFKSLSSPKFPASRLQCSSGGRYVAFFQQGKGVVVLCTEHSPEARPIRIYDAANQAFNAACKPDANGKCTKPITGEELMKTVKGLSIYKEGKVVIEGTSFDFVVDSPRAPYGDLYKPTNKEKDGSLLMAGKSEAIEAGSKDWYVKYIYDDANNVWYKFNKETGTATEKAQDGRRMGFCGSTATTKPTNGITDANYGSKLACIAEVRQNPTMWTRIDPLIEKK